MKLKPTTFKIKPPIFFFQQAARRANIHQVQVFAGTVTLVAARPLNSILITSIFVELKLGYQHNGAHNLGLKFFLSNGFYF